MKRILMVLIFMLTVGTAQAALSDGIKYYINWADTTTIDQVSHTTFFGESDGPSEQPNFIGPAMQFQTMSATDSFANISGTQSFSVCFWENITSYTNTINDLSVNNGIILFPQFGQENQWIYEQGIGADYYYLNSTIGAVTLGQWNHICLTRNETNSTSFYTNGALDVTTNAIPAGIWDGGNIVVQLIDTHGLDEFGVWSRALSASEVQQLYQYGTEKVTYPFSVIRPPTSDLGANLNSCSPESSNNFIAFAFFALLPFVFLQYFFRGQSNILNVTGIVSFVIAISFILIALQGC